MSRARTSTNPNRDATRIFHREWLGLAQPIEGLVFSVPALDEAPVPAARTDITAALRTLLVASTDDAGDSHFALRSADDFFRRFLGYDAPGMLIPRASLPAELTFYAPESRQEIRPTFAIARGPFDTAADDPFAIFDAPRPTASPPSDPLSPPGERAGERGAPIASPTASPYIALLWDLADDSPAFPSTPPLDLDSPEDVTGPWRYPPTAKLERLLRHVGVPVGFITNRRELRLVYAPPGEATSHLTFRFDDLADPAGRPIALALELLFHARRTYRADPKHTFEGLLAESRRRQADVTEALAQQVFESVERLLEGFESAAARDVAGDRPDWLRAALDANQVYDGVLNVILRLVFLLYAEDRSLLPVAHPTYAAHLSVLGLHERLTADAGAHPESMYQRYGGYGALVSLFRALYFGVHHGDLHLPPRQGRLFDPSAFPFLEGGMPDWTAAVALPEDRAAVRLPTIDDGTLHEVLHRLVVLDGQRLSYRDLSVEQIGAVYESLMGYRVERMSGPAVRLGKLGFWVEVESLRSATKTERDKLLDERCGLTKPAIKKALSVLSDAALQKGGDDALADALVELSPGGKSERTRHRARATQLVLQPTASRRSTGSHYTPRSLSEKVVRRTLEPILACLGESPTAAQILQLKVCDPAMGSGAFLVESCRFLGEAVVEAWRRSGELPAVLEKHGDPLLHAKRLVAQRCLYGVDKNAAAVELAKLSLWLETLSGDHAFTFLDHVLRHGDSLVGLDVEQVRAFHWAPKAQLETVGPLVDRALAEVREQREAIHALADDESDHAQREKRRLLELADQAMERVKRVADVCVGAFFAQSKPKAREEERNRRLPVVEAYLAGDESAAPQIEEWANAIRAQHAPFHWHLELPEVFFLERADPLDGGVKNRAAFVDAFVGNPPFLGRKYVAPMYGAPYGDWLYSAHPGSHGRCDLAAHFLRRGAELIGEHGSIGFIATSTLSEGDTRESGITVLLDDRWMIYDVESDIMWPGSANLTVSTVHFGRGTILAHVQARLNGLSVRNIDSRFTAAEERPALTPLAINAGINVNGLNTGGSGFVIDERERMALVAAHPETATRLPMYIGGEDILGDPAQAATRYVVDLNGLSDSDLNHWPTLRALVEDRVRPERERISLDSAEARLRTRWWEFRRKAAYRLEGYDRCLVAGIYATHWCLSFQPATRAFNNKTSVFHLRSYSAFSILQCRVHELWAVLLSPTMGAANTLAYAPSECFLTFPFPQPDPRAVIPALEDVGQRLYDARAAYMVATQQGLTQTYNKLKDAGCDDAPIVALRRLHDEMDAAVLAAYGWSDLAVPPFCPVGAEEHKALERFQDAIVDRLFVLNAERAAEEARSGVGVKGGTGTTKRAKAGPRKKSAISSQASLFGKGET